LFCSLFIDINRPFSGFCYCRLRIYNTKFLSLLVVISPNILDLRGLNSLKNYLAWCIIQLGISYGICFLYLVVLFLPLLSFFINSFSRVFGRKIASLGSLLLISFSCALSLVIFYEVCICYGTVSLKLFDWAEIGLVKISFGLLFDSLTVVMIVIIL
jgi:hypothetical protein